MTSYKELIVWQKTFNLTLRFYRLSKIFPKEEMFFLTAQMRRDVISIISNIAEGYTRKTTKDYHHFITIAFGSATEFEVQLLLAKELDYVSEKDYQELNNLLIEVLKMLNKLSSSLKNVTNYSLITSH